MNTHNATNAPNQNVAREKANNITQLELSENKECDASKDGRESKRGKSCSYDCSRIIFAYNLDDFGGQDIEKGLNKMCINSLVCALRMGNERTTTSIIILPLPPWKALAPNV
jgi:hypothetical protein